MLTHQLLTPLQYRALRAAVADPKQRLVRCRGGYRPAGCADAPVFTTRTVNAMERDYLVTFTDDFPHAAVVTSKGRKIVADAMAEPAKAGAA